MNRESSGLFQAVEINRARLKQRFEHARLNGDAWLVECRDLWDALDRDAGVYFVACRDDAALEETLRRCPDDGLNDRVLGIFDVCKPLEQQGGGLTRGQWLSGLR